LFRFNHDQKVAVAWGETKYGKLGVGNIASLINERAQIEKARRNNNSNNNNKLMNGSSSTNSSNLTSNNDEKSSSLVPSFLPPTKIEAFQNKHISTCNYNMLKYVYFEMLLFLLVEEKKELMRKISK